MVTDALHDEARPVVGIHLIHQRGQQRHAAGRGLMLRRGLRAQLRRCQLAAAQSGRLAQIVVGDAPGVQLLAVPAARHVHARVGDAPQRARGLLETLAHQAVKRVHGNEAVQRPDGCDAVAGGVDLSGELRRDRVGVRRLQGCVALGGHVPRLLGGLIIDAQVFGVHGIHSYHSILESGLSVERGDGQALAVARAGLAMAGLDFGTGQSRTMRRVTSTST